MLPFLDKRRTIQPDQIVRLEAQINYTLIWFRDGSHLLVALTIKRLFDRLPAEDFLRPHRKHVVNRRCVESISPINYRLHLFTGETVVVSRRKLAGVRRQMRQTV